jgi:REP-associated tyrosine transposase
MPQRRSYRRHLPHIIPEGVPIFVTWNLKGALPRRVLDELESERRRLENEPRRAGETPAQRRIRIDKMMFGKTDAFLDSADSGPLHLKEPGAAKIVEDSILFGAGTRYELFAYVVMANHVHVLLTPIWEYQKLTQGIKGYTAYEINRLHNARGRVFWQDECYDHACRDDEEFFRIIAYIENNPVKAGLCVRPEDWLCSSGVKRVLWPVGQAFQPDASGRKALERQ